MFTQISCLPLFFTVFLFHWPSATGKTITIDGCCSFIDYGPRTGVGCGIPDFVDPAEFGDNKDTDGILRMRPVKDGVKLNIRLFNLSRPDHVLTAWFGYVNLSQPQESWPEAFQVAADPFAPLSAFNSGYSSGLGKDPNQFRYVSDTEARLSVKLNFNPSYPGEGALVNKRPSFQKDTPGIQKTEWKQYPTQQTDQGNVYSVLGASFLRMYNEDTGFELLGRDGKPMVARSPGPATIVFVINHVDHTSHGIYYGIDNVDVYSVLTFVFEEGVMIGRRTVVVSNTSVSSLYCSYLCNRNCVKCIPILETINMPSNITEIHNPFRI